MKYSCSILQGPTKVSFLMHVFKRLQDMKWESLGENTEWPYAQILVSTWHTI